MLLYPLIAILLCLSGFYIVKLTQNVYLGWVSLLVIDLYSYGFGNRQGMVGALHLSPGDGISMCLLVAGALRSIPRMKESNTPRMLAFGYFFLIFLSYARGVFINGFTTASNEARGLVAPIAGVLYFLTAPVDEESIRKYIDAYILYGVGLLVIAVLAYAGFNVGAEAWAQSDTASAGIDGRLLPSAPAAALAICFLLTLARAQYRQSSVWYRFLPILFLGMAIYLRHRTVWMMLIVCGLCLPFVEQKLTRRFLAIGFAIAILVGAVLLVQPQIVTENSSQFEDSTQNTGTFMWRVNSWAQLVWDEDQTVLTVLTGDEMGHGSWRYVPEAGKYEDVAPHSEYVSEYTRVGLIGVIFLVIYIVWPLKYTLRRSKDDNLAVDPSWGTWALVVIGAMVYGFTYSIEGDFYALIAIANAMVVAHRRDSESEAPELVRLPA